VTNLQHVFLNVALWYNSKIIDFDGLPLKYLTFAQKLGLFKLKTLENFVSFLYFFIEFYNLKLECKLARSYKSIKTEEQ